MAAVASQSGVASVIILSARIENAVATWPADQGEESSFVPCAFRFVRDAEPRARRYLFMRVEIIGAF
jgi:hypothetical protein